MKEKQPDAPAVSVITAAFNEEENIPLLYERLKAVFEEAGMAWEWIVVDDRSSDGTFAAVRRLADGDPRVRGFRLSRNFGSHRAFLCGAAHARGSAAVCLAGDLQDPPEIIPALLERHSAGARVVWGVRSARPGESASTRGFSRFYYYLMRRIAGLKDMPAAGADCFLLDASVLREVIACPERHTSVLALITWMGYTRDEVPYEKARRVHGRSGWTLAKKVALVTDSVTGFTAFPLRLLFFLGAAVAASGFLLALVLAPGGYDGGRGLAVLITVLGGLQLAAAGIVGEYLWRALEEIRRRPRVIIEETAGGEGAS